MKRLASKQLGLVSALAAVGMLLAACGGGVNDAAESSAAPAASEAASTAASGEASAAASEAALPRVRGLGDRDARVGRATPHPRRS